MIKNFRSEEIVNNELREFGTGLFNGFAISMQDLINEG